MQNLTINPAYVGKTVTKDLGYTVQRIEVDKIKPSQYQRVFNMGFEEIFLTDGKEREYTSDEVIENTSGIDTVVGKVQKTPTGKRKPKVG